MWIVNSIICINNGGSTNTHEINGIAIFIIIENIDVIRSN